MTAHPPQHLVLSIYPFIRGFAFVFLEGPDSPFEWGVKEIKGNHRSERTIAEIKKLIDRYRPEVLVIEEKADVRRTNRIRKVYRMLLHLAGAEYLEVYRCTKREVAECFAEVGAKTKREIAQAVALQIPAFAHRMPSERKPWQGEDSRQSLFDAAALAMAYYTNTNNS